MKHLGGGQPPPSSIQKMIKMYSLAEVAQTMRISRSMVHREIVKGRIESVKIGKRRLVTERALADYVRLLEKEAKKR